MRERAKEEGITISPQTHGMAAMTKGCLAGTGVCFVSHKGEVFPCGYLPVEAGHVKKQKFADIWKNSPVFEKLRNPDLLEGKCGDCEYKKVCEGCRLVHFTIQETIWRKNHIVFISRNLRVQTKIRP